MRRDGKNDMADVPVKSIMPEAGSDGLRDQTSTLDSNTCAQHAYLISLASGVPEAESH